MVVIDESTCGVIFASKVRPEALRNCLQPCSTSTSNRSVVGIHDSYGRIIEKRFDKSNTNGNESPVRWIRSVRRTPKDVQTNSRKSLFSSQGEIRLWIHHMWRYQKGYMDREYAWNFHADHRVPFAFRQE